MRGEVIESGEGTVVVARTGGCEPKEIPGAGTVGLDTTPSDRSIERQRAALHAVDSGLALRGDLRRLLADPSTCEVASRASVDLPEGLDEAQAHALRLAAASPDIVAIAGPPGTGKTTLIANLVAMEVGANPGAHILIASQTHVAVDNALERIGKSAVTNGAAVSMLRVASKSADKVSDGVGKWLLPAQLNRWRTQVVERSRAWVDAEAKRCGLDVQALHTAMDFDELAAISEAISLTQKRLSALGAVSPGEETADSGAETDSVARLVTDRQQTAASDDEHALQAESDGVREERDVLRVDRRALIDRLVARRSAPSRSKLEQASPDDLRRLADETLTGPAETVARLKQLVGLQAEWAARFGKSDDFAAALVRRSTVVGGTCVGLAGLSGFDQLEFDLCIVDEASRATPTETLVPMVRAKRWILVGDDRQLPPYVDQALKAPALLDDFDLSRDDVSQTLFGWLQITLPDECQALLASQYRMDPAIGTLVSECFYGGELINGRLAEPPVAGALFQRPVRWLTTAALGESRRETRRGTSYSNPGEARQVVEVLTQLARFRPRARKRDAPLRIGVLAGYAAQCDLIRSMLEQKLAGWPNLDVEVGTVDAVQGREFAVVIFSLTRSNDQGNQGHLQDERRINVALSRAQHQLVIVGDHGFAASTPDGPLGRILAHVRAHPDDCELVEATDD